VIGMASNNQENNKGEKDFTFSILGTFLIEVS